MMAMQLGFVTYCRVVSGSWRMGMQAGSGGVRIADGKIRPRAFSLNYSITKIMHACRSRKFDDLMFV